MNLLKEEIVMGGQSLTVKERIAEGGFGFVDLVMNPMNGQEFVLKRCGIQRQENYDIVNKEITLLKRFRHRNIVHLISSEILTVGGKREALLLLEYCPGGHLLQRLNARNGTPLPNSDICRIFGQILQAVLPLHESSPPVIHRDLKLENILHSIGGDVKLCDFGSCMIGYVPTRTPEERSKAEEAISKETTQMYRAPEMVDLYMRDELTESTDIWALGCILYCLCFISHPFQDAGNLGILSAKVTMPHDSAVPPDMKVLIMRMLDMDAEARPSVQYLIQATDALATNNAIPPYELSAIALQRREERIAAQQRRTSLAKKHNPNVVPTREAAVPLAANSVAARRLAAKRGGVSAGTELAGSIPHPGYSQPVSRSSAPAPSGGSADDLFFSDAPARSGDSSAVSASLFDDFGSAPAAAPASDGGFDMFSSPVKSAPPAPARAAAPATASANFFDADDNFGTIANAAPSTSAASASADLFGGDDFFTGGAAVPPPAPAQHKTDSFDMFSSPVPAPAPARSAPGTDVFGSGSDLLSDMSFSAAPPPSQAQKASTILNMFEQTPTQGRGGGMQYDPFGGMGGPGGGAGMGMGRSGGYQQQPPQGGMYGGGYQGGGVGPGYGNPGAGAGRSMFSSSQQKTQSEPDPFGALGVVKK